MPVAAGERRSVSSPVWSCFCTGELTLRRSPAATGQDRGPPNETHRTTAGRPGDPCGHGSGSWSVDRRWQKSADLKAAADRLHDLPTEFGEWCSRPDEQSVEGLEETRAEGWWIRRFTSRRTRQSVLVMLLCGRAAAMVAHRPENCYSGAGYELEGAPAQYAIRQARGEPLGEFWTGQFVKEEAVGKTQLRIFWSWLAEGTWQAPSAPRWTFRGQPYLYKLYVLRDSTDRPNRLDNDPTVDLLRQLIPRLTERLAPR